MAVQEQVSIVERPLTEVGSAQRRPGWGARYDDGLMGVILLAGPANIVMQLALPGVGYGVKESRVHGGRVDRHPIKRARTTFTYLAVAMNGTDEQKAHFRRAVNRAHAQVYSTEESPVQYHAMDKDLQMWVAACLYKGSVDVHRMFIGEMDEAMAEAHYRRGMTLGTTLQVPAEMWPKDRAAFDEYWNRMLERVHIDDAVRDYLMPIVSGNPGRFRLPGPLQGMHESLAIFITTGFLPQRFRDEMKLPWDAGKERRFRQLMAALRTGNNLLPSVLRKFPFNVLLKDLDWRVRTGRPLA